MSSKLPMSRNGNSTSAGSSVVHDDIVLRRQSAPRRSGPAQVVEQVAADDDQCTPPHLLGEPVQGLGHIRLLAGRVVAEQVGHHAEMLESGARGNGNAGARVEESQSDTILLMYSHICQ